MQASESVIKIVDARHDIRNSQELTALWALEGVQVRSKGSHIKIRTWNPQNHELRTANKTKLIILF